CIHCYCSRALRVRHSFPTRRSSDLREPGILPLMPGRAVKMELFDQFARVAQALASGRRVEIVDVLTNGDRTVEELAQYVDDLNSDRKSTRLNSSHGSISYAVFCLKK